MQPSSFSNFSPFQVLSVWFLKYFIKWQWCWWHRYVGDFMIVTDRSLTSWNRSPTEIGHQHPESVNIISNLSPTHLVSTIRHQHRCNQVYKSKSTVWIRKTFLTSSNCIIQLDCEASCKSDFTLQETQLFTTNYTNINAKMRIMGLITRYCYISRLKLRHTSQVSGLTGSMPG